jgi:hypothetical protein
MPHAHNHPSEAGLSMQSIIPLYGVSTEHITQPTLTRIPSPARGRASARHRHHHHPQHRVNSYHHHYR